MAISSSTSKPGKPAALPLAVRGSLRVRYLAPYPSLRYANIARGSNVFPVARAPVRSGVEGVALRDAVPLGVGGPERRPVSGRAQVGTQQVTGRVGGAVEEHGLDGAPDPDRDRPGPGGRGEPAATGGVDAVGGRDPVEPLPRPGRDARRDLRRGRRAGGARVRRMALRIEDCAPVGDTHTAGLVGSGRQVVRRLRGKPHRGGATPASGTSNSTAAAYRRNRRAIRWLRASAVSCRRWMPCAVAHWHRCSTSAVPIPWPWSPLGQCHGRVVVAVAGGEPGRLRQGETAVRPRRVRDL
jgi:hypothetical protein